MDSLLVGRPGQTIVRRLRFVSPGRDVAVSETAVARWLESGSLDVSGLPPGALLCVRRLPDPLAGRWRWPRSALAAPPPAWQAAVAEALAATARQAVRPAERAVPAGADAVLFAGTTELLACLASDWLSGSLVRCWWWQALLGPALDQGATPALIQAWVRATAAAPGALDLLARRRLAVAFVQALPVGSVADLLLELAREFDLAGIAAALGDPALDVLDGPTVRVEASLPWSAWMPEARSAGLVRLQAAYLGIGLGLVRAPAAVRRAGFARDVAAWLAAPVSAAGRLHTAEQARSASEPAAPIPLVVSSRDPEQQIAAVSRSQSEPSRMHDRRAAEQRPATESWPSPQVVEERATQRSEPGQVSSPEGHPPGAAHTPEARQAGKARPSAGQTFDQSDRSGQSDWSFPAPPPETTPPSPLDSPLSDAGLAFADSEEPAPSLAEPQEVVHTDFGGVFYLINLGIYLGHYGDFSTPLQPGLALSIYDFVALVGEGLCDEPGALHEDTVWPLLARLAGRGEGEPPGAGFAPPDGSSLAQWLAVLLAAVRKRLLLALGLPDDDRAGLSRLLLAQCARAAVTPTRLDVTFALDEHPIQIRLSGLDRDPGWVPAAGRFVAFHFE